MNNAEKRMSRTGVVFGCALICCFLWGSAAPSIKIGYRLFDIAADDSMAQLVFAGMRFMLAGIMVILAGTLLSRKEGGEGLLKPARTSLPLILKLAMVQTVAQYIFYYVGLAHTTGVKAAVIGGSNVFLSIFIAVAVFHMEKLTPRKLLGCAAGFAGVVIINVSGKGIDMSVSFLGEGFILLSSLSYALSSGLIKKYSAKENPVALSGYQFLCGGIVLTLTGLAAGGRVKLSDVPAGGWALLGYMGLISAAAYTLWGILLKYNPVARVAVFGFMNPVFSFLLSALLLGEGSQALGWSALSALALVCAGILIVNLPEAPLPNAPLPNGPLSNTSLPGGPLPNAPLPDGRSSRERKKQA